ncbi:sugar transferase [Nocardioides panacis]|uniref:Sugar transferase n=1 Tax=Nocardioides panacis TaxID=2849501 RepID=A0A975Y1I4_9ACTN|nr:sugar transferase [Nocardioides panacis]QWZ09545.1 sugar transferase [Nocardioides panacis]
MTDAWTARGSLSWVRAADLAVKRLIDVTVAAVALVCLSPLYLLLVVLVRCSGPGGAIFRQTRLGASRKPFVMYKFRTMQSDCDATLHQDYVRRLLAGEVTAEGGLYKLPSDPRVTRIGSFLRRSSLDELPQLFNVLRGDMSLVGPRPALPYEVERFPPWADPRFTVRPGITGLWQVSGRNRLPMLEGIRLDLEYVARRNLWTDLVILARTAHAVLEGGAR